ncbi:MAG TPA: ABC transporter permease [Micromonosporaceae bacterium]|nr:ABC transporter permease [Micromonosporaceae bacterium]
MIRFLIIRLLRAVLTLWIISVVTFAMFFALPTNPASALCGKSCTPERIEEVRRSFGLDRPKIEQYGSYMKGLFVDRQLTEGAAGGKLCEAPCFGFSYVRNQMVGEALRDTFPVTLSLVIPAFIIYILLGVGIGVTSALRRGTAYDKFAVGFSLAGASMQIYSVGLLLMFIFVFSLKIAPPPHYTPITQNPWDWAAGLWIGWASLAFISLAIYARLSRAQMLETLSEDFVRTAQAKGLSKARVYGRHALRAAITPIVTLAGLDIGFLLGGAVITETTTSVYGVGSLAVEAIRQGDLSIVMATVLIASVFVVTFVVIVDALYAVIDPRVKLA